MAQFFLPSRGKNNNGHAHIDSLYKNGIRQFIVEDAVPFDTYLEANIIQVQSSIDALQKLQQIIG